MKLPDELKPTLWEKTGLWQLPAYLRRVKGVLMADVVNLPKGMVARKTVAATGGSVIATLVCSLALYYFEVELDAEQVSIVIGGVISTAVFLASWFTRTAAKEVSQARMPDGTVVKSQKPGAPDVVR